MQIQAACAYIIGELTSRLVPQLTYHSVQHTHDVAEQADRIARAEGINDDESLNLLKTAAYYHDAGFLVTYDEHEVESCQLAMRSLPAFGYTPEQIDQICQMIRATRTPQTPTTLLGAILCDADLDYLGRDDYYQISQTLLTEWIAYNRLADPARWPHIQRSFLTNHQYFTSTNQQLREPYKQQIIAAIRTE
ncbi:HD domain-containing protein [Spirosoma sp. HMF3257]|uniref:Metal-dependent phosphohydrolase n=1 Tax=Spirosoma telluris TaxID=2183553 RepID=A0A327NRG6_9BACT|nr:HD domain-containing protein [Spirosoma telluris]RAI77872.1 metal-dependent phosphohydrolase [Spirosoma telluris]